LKQYGEQVTVLKDNLFLKAKLKLTALYIIILIAVLTAFSIALYYSFANNINDAIGDEFENDQTQAIVVNNTLNQLRLIIFITDGAALCIFGGLSYLLAVSTLKPIKIALDREEQFSSDVSHELKTPITLMQTNLEVLLREKKLKLSDFKEIAKDNLIETRHMGNIIDQLLFLTRSKEVDTPIDQKIFSISKSLEQAVNSFKTYAEQKKIEINCSIGDVSFLGDEQQIKRAIINLIKNAIDYNKPGGSIFISLKKEKQYLELKVKDSGIGMEEEQIPRIFERFYQIEKSRKRKEGNSGLGLSIVKKIISMHKGKIYVQSEPGHGTTFIINLPLPKNFIIP
jgi:two-component system, OmpR family, sensor histidine kinase CiaH